MVPLFVQVSHFYGICGRFKILQFSRHWNATRIEVANEKKSIEIKELLFIHNNIKYIYIYRKMIVILMSAHALYNHFKKSEWIWDPRTWKEINFLIVDLPLFQSDCIILAQFMTIKHSLTATDSHLNLMQFLIKTPVTQTYI